MKKWYVIFTRHGYEDKVKKLINKYFFRYDIDIIVPKKKITERKNGKSLEVVKTLFPGYVFVNIELNKEIYYEFKELMSFASFLKEDSKPASVLYDEIKIIFNLTGKNDMIEISKGINVGGKIEIIDGPLKGYEGLILKIDKRKGRAKIRLDIAKHTKIVDVGLHIIKGNDKESSDIANFKIS